MKKTFCFLVLGIFFLSGCGQVEKEVKIPHPENIRAYEPTQEELDEAECIKESMEAYQERYELEAEKALYGYVEDKPSIEQTLFSKDSESAPMTKGELEQELYYDQLEELAVCVMAEAGNQGVDGMRMVCDVILNRVDDTDFPDNIHDVISQPFHFSSYWDGGTQRWCTPSEECYKAVQMELENVSYPGLFYFQTGNYSQYGTPAFKFGEHYFSTK